MADGLDILVTGGAGRLGRALGGAEWPEGVRLHRLDRARLDIVDAGSVAAVFAGQRFDAVINAAAFTGVDAAESRAGAAFAANATGPARLADAARDQGARLIQLSTDYVFDGTLGRACAEDDRPAPLNIYGASKYAGELAVLSAAPGAAVVRTAWLFGVGGQDFIGAVLARAATGDRLEVVTDQSGSPTAVGDLAQALVALTLRLVGDPAAPGGVWHFANAGEASRFDLAAAALEASAALGGPAGEVVPVTTAQRPSPVRRPARTPLSTARIQRELGLTPRPWREAVGAVVADMAARRLGPWEGRS